MSWKDDVCKKLDYGKREREEADDFKAIVEQEFSFCIVPNHMVVSIYGS